MFAKLQAKYRPLVFLGLAAIVWVAVAFAGVPLGFYNDNSASPAVTYMEFTDAIFADLQAHVMDCSEIFPKFGDLDRCGLVDNNRLIENTTTISDHVSERNMDITHPWAPRELNSGERDHQLLVRGKGWTYNISYLEISPDRSLVSVSGFLH